MPGVCSPNVPLVVFGLALVLTSPPVLVRSPGGGETPRVGPSADPGPSPTVAVDPSTWWMESGSNTTLVATWVGDPAGCALQPIWFRWSVAAGGSEGALGGTNGSSTTFLAADQGSGTTSVEVQAAASLRCDGNASAAFSAGFSVITVAAPLSLSALAIDPDPVAPGEPTDLVGVVTGGEAPYQLQVQWGDGNASESIVDAPGPFAIPHVFGLNGSFAPAVVATDAVGEASAATAPEPAYVNDGFAVAIRTATPVGEVGVPVVFQVQVKSAPGNFTPLFACPDALPAGVGNATGLVYGCAFTVAGSDPVTFEAFGARAPFAATSATLNETVVPPPALAFPGPPAPAEVGVGFYEPFQLSGGVPPFSVSWALVGAGASGDLTVGADGVDYLPLEAPRAGTFVLALEVTDALGALSAEAAEDVAVAPRLLATAVAAASVAGVAVGVNVSASVAEGAPPFDWAVVPALPVLNATAAAGLLPVAGDLAWNASLRAEGTLPVTVAVVDGDGATAVVNLTVVLLPRLNVTAQAASAGPGDVTLSFTVSGGLPPYVYSWNDTQGMDWNGSSAAAGPVTVRVATSETGPTAFSLRVVDGLGVVVSAQAGAVLPTPPPLTTDGAPPFIALTLVLLGLGGAGVLFLRRRRRTPEPPAPDPVTVLREAIEPSDGVDRGTVELLAEEAGLAPDLIRSTLDRLIAEGTVRSGRGGDGEEVLAWSRSLAP